METRELSWAAGLFEGEGSRGKRLQLKMTREDCVRRFHAAVEVGQVYGPYGPYRSQLGRKPYWQWVAHRPEDIRTVLLRLGPHFTE